MACWLLGGGRYLGAKKPEPSLVKMVYLFIKALKTDIKTCDLKYLNLLILCTSFASSNWKWDAVKPSFIICSSEKWATSHLLEQYFVTVIYKYVQAYFFTAFDLLTCKNKL